MRVTMRWVGEKRALYDDLNMQEWAVGQLSNIYHIQDPNTEKQSLPQVILSLRDAISLTLAGSEGSMGQLHARTGTRSSKMGGCYTVGTE